MHAHSFLFRHAKDPAWWLGLTLVLALSATAQVLGGLPEVRHAGIGALTLSIVLGMAVGNTLFPAIARRTATGVDFSKNTLLRAGIVLYGFRITFQQIAGIGWTGALIDVSTLSLTFLLALQLGRRLFKMDGQTSILIGAGSAICGAAAIIATESVLRSQAHKVSTAVATVVVFGTASMFIYPHLYPWLGLSESAYGVYAGSTIHEVAQAVAAGKSVGETAADAAVIEKMLRVMMLAPFLLILSVRLGIRSDDHKIAVPWFAVYFVAATALNSLHVLPEGITAILIQTDTLLLAAAMAALGLRTHFGAIRQAGVRPLLLAATLFVFLTVGGYWINRAIMHWAG